jgi:galactokinase
LPCIASRDALTMVNRNRLVAEFTERYGTAPRLFSAPGRVNIIGEHTDYNDGFVLPMAINRRTFVAIAPREDRVVSVAAVVLNDATEFKIDECADLSAHQWAKYVAGVTWTLKKHGLALRGADIMIDSDVPIGGGLSSSAALEVATGRALTTIADATIAPKELALAAQKAEHDFVGAKVGIMDQLTATLGREQHALLIDCRSLAIREISLANLNAAIVVCNTNVKHELASSAYNQRRAECEEAVEVLSQRLPGIRALRDVTIADFQKYEKELPQPVRRRGRHVVTENDRTLKAAQALECGDRHQLGELMMQSHESLRTDYEVSCRELDLMVEIASRYEGVFGARMTGGGFGGCTINIVSDDQVESFTQTVAEEYRATTDIDPDVYVVKGDDGAQEEIL